MKTIVVRTQSELDALPDKFDEFTYIEIRSERHNWIYVTTKRGNSSVVAWGNSSVVARENSSVVARGNSSVVAWGNSSVVAWGNSSVVAWGNSSVVARENSSVEAWGNSSVVARENSSVVARENSSVVARENSSVEAQDFSMIAVIAATVVIKKLLDYSIASLRGVKPKIEKKSRTATVVKTPEAIERKEKDFFDRVESVGKDSVILYKSVNPETMCDFYTGKIKYEGVVKCPDFDSDKTRQCGGGLHLSPTRGDALSYNQGHLLKCKVKKSDIIVYPSDMTKVRCKRVEVLGKD